MEQFVLFPAYPTMNERMMINEAVKALGVEPARFQFLEACSQDFLSRSRFEIPRRYGAGDLRILAAANVLLGKGLPPSAVKACLGRILAEPSGWEKFAGVSAAHGSSVARSIAITSGKGGVGKSNIALGLGVELVGSGIRTVLMDADFGVANIHLLAGLKTGRTLRDVASGQCGIDDVIASVPQGPDIIPGSAGILELANLSATRRQMLLGELRKIESRYDVVLIDTAAGVAGSVLDFVATSDFVLVVTTAEATAIADAYALIKLSLERNAYCRIGVVANRVRSTREGASTLARISDCARRFLGKSVLELGYIWEDSNVRRSVNERVPFSLRYPKSRASSALRKLTRLLQDKDIVTSRSRVGKPGFTTFSSHRSLLEAAVID